jgi:hypothetical protein
MVSHNQEEKKGRRYGAAGAGVTHGMSTDCAIIGTNDSVGCIVPSHLFLETQITTVAYLVTVKTVQFLK